MYLLVYYTITKINELEQQIIMQIKPRKLNAVGEKNKITLG